MSNIQLEELYIKLADAKPGAIDAILDEIEALQIKPTPTEPILSSEEFAQHYNIRSKYERFHSEYGDAATLYTEFLEYRYTFYRINGAHSFEAVFIN